MDDAELIREALRAMPPAAASRASETPEPSSVYAPQLHGNALRSDRPLVIGNRGVGKSFWAGVLANSETREVAASLYAQDELRRMRVALGFHEAAGKTEGPAPSSDQLVALRGKGFTSKQIWTSVLLTALGDLTGQQLPPNLSDLVQWSSSNLEETEAILRRADATLLGDDERFLLVFDALDQLAPDWPTIRELTTSLLRFALEARGYRAIRVKIFLRTDQWHDEALFRFPDASKLRSERVELVWRQTDLYGLIYQYLWHHSSGGPSFRRAVSGAWESTALPGHSDFPQQLRTSDAVQARVFSALAGEFMGTNPRRGRTYNWLHDHLADASGQTSPRSFQVALRRAAESVDDEAPRVLDHTAIKSGVQAASELRVEQLTEDYPWIRLALEALEHLEVPVDREVFIDRWRDRQTVQRIVDQAGQDTRNAPIEFVDLPSEESILHALSSIGVIEKRSESRINVPDIFRVAAKLKRRGGVRVPTRRG